MTFHLIIAPASLQCHDPNATCEFSRKPVYIGTLVVKLDYKTALILEHSHVLSAASRYLLTNAEQEHRAAVRMGGMLYYLCRVYSYSQEHDLEEGDSVSALPDRKNAWKSKM